MYNLMTSSTDAQALVAEIRRLEVVQLRLARSEQDARRRAQTARVGLWLGIALGVVVFVSDVNFLIHATSWWRLVAGALLLVAAYALRGAYVRFRGAQAHLLETRGRLAELHARLRALRAHQAA